MCVQKAHAIHTRVGQALVDVYKDNPPPTPVRSLSCRNWSLTRPEAPPLRRYQSPTAGGACGQKARERTGQAQRRVCLHSIVQCTCACTPTRRILGARTGESVQGQARWGTVALQGSLIAQERPRVRGRRKTQRGRRPGCGGRGGSLPEACA